MIAYLVAATEAQGIKDAEARGWQRIARSRFVTANKDDIRVIWRISELIPLAGGTPMIKGSDYEEGPPSSDRIAFARWVGEDDQPGEKERFDNFVANGNGTWTNL